MRNFLVILIVIVFVSSTFAQDYGDILRYSTNENGTNARSLGMGNSVAAFGGDLSGMIFNPATIALSKYSQFSFGVDLNNVETKGDFLGNTLIQDKSKNNFSSVGFISPIPTRRGSFVFGFSYNRVNDFTKSFRFNGFNSSDNSMVKTLAYANDKLAYNLGLSYEVFEDDNYKFDDTKINGNLQQVGNTNAEGFIDKFAGAFALEWGKNLFVGFTINLLSGEFKQTRVYNEIDSRDVYGSDMLLDDSDDRTKDFQSFKFTDQLYQEVFGYGFTGGFLYKFKNGFNLAGTIKSPDFIEIKEKYKVKGYSSFESTDFETDWFHNNLTYDVKTPLEYTLGGSFTRNHLSLSGSVTFINYKEMEFTNGFSQSVEDEKNIIIDENFRSVANFNIGLEYKIPKIPLKLRGGFIFKKSPYKNDESRYDKKHITAGIGYKIGRNLYMDVAYLYGWWEDLSDNYGVNESRTYQKLKKSNLVFNITMRL